MHNTHKCIAHILKKNHFGDRKLKEITILSRIEEYTKYFDLCYWKERRKNPDSTDLKNWTARKRTKFRNLWFGENNAHEEF